MSHELGDIYYHYTGVQAAHGILTRKKVWLSDFRFLNDAQELHSAIELLRGCCTQEQRSALSAAMDWTTFSNFQCILSLSRSPHILSQWRAYAADGRGMALGFQEWALKAVGFEIVPCIYDKHKEYATHVYERHREFLDELTNARKHQAYNEFTAWVSSKQMSMEKILKDLIPIKNGAFSEEQEVRALVSVPYQDIQLRVRDELLIPYTERLLHPPDDEWPLSVIVPRVWLGPKCDERNRTGLFAAFKDLHIVDRYDCGYV